MTTRFPSASFGLPFVKRLFDLALSIPAFFILSFLMLIIAVLVRMRIGSPVLFRQARPGLVGRPFTIYKFRTMTNEQDEDGNLLPDGERRTPLGQFLRNTSMDELPELFNVIKGDMSIVGPRPLRVAYLSRYSMEQARRHELVPGITGWAQVNGRNAISWEDKFKLDVWYVDHHNFILDLKIIWMTIWQIIKRQEINANGHATMPPFKGNSQ